MTETPALSRRERQRKATSDEIVATARRLIRDREGVSLRAVAAAMGMTPPALYRYVDGYDELVALVVSAIFDDIVEALRTAADAHAEDDPGARLTASAVAFRQWALAHPDEFALIFADRATVSPDPGGPPPPQAEKGEGALRFVTFFSALYLAVWRRYDGTLPDAADIPADAAALLQAASDAGELPCEFPGAPVGLSWVFLRAWSRLYGTVTLEVFGHIDASLISSGALFIAMMEDNVGDLGVGEDRPRLRDVMLAALAESASARP